jgi:hypothetical protein
VIIVPLFAELQPRRKVSAWDSHEDRIVHPVRRGTSGVPLARRIRCLVRPRKQVQQDKLFNSHQSPVNDLENKAFDAYRRAHDNRPLLHDSFSDTRVMLFMFVEAFKTPEARRVLLGARGRRRVDTTLLLKGLVYS